MTTLSQFPISARAAALDLGRARRWCEGPLGLVPEREDPGGAWYRFAGETWPYLLGTPPAGTVRIMIAGWAFRDIELVMPALPGRGVTTGWLTLGPRKQPGSRNATATPTS